MPKFGTNCIVQAAGNGQLRRRLRQDQTRPSPRPPRNHPLRVLDFLRDATNCCGSFGGDECWMRRYPRCPRWGKCREAAKGVQLVTFGCYQSTNNTPSVSLCSTAPPPGSQGMRQTSPERGGGATAPEGSGAVRRIPIGIHQGEFVQAPLASPGGSQGDQAFSSKCLDRDL